MIGRRSFGVGVTLAALLSPLGAQSAQGAVGTAPTLLVLVYSGGSYPARPAGTVGGGARYVGPTQPSSWLPGDEWVQIS